MKKLMTVIFSILLCGVVYAQGTPPQRTPPASAPKDANPGAWEQIKSGSKKVGDGIASGARTVGNQVMEGGRYVGRQIKRGATATKEGAVAAKEKVAPATKPAQGRDATPDQSVKP